MEKEKKYFVVSETHYKDYNLVSAEFEHDKILVDTVKVEEGLVFEIKKSNFNELIQLLAYFNLEIKEVDIEFIRVKVNKRGIIW